MKIIKYKICNRVNHGTEEEPIYEDILSPVEIHCTADNLEANEAIAQKEAYNGEYTIEDDGVEEISEPTEYEIIDARLTYVEMMTGLLEV